MLDENDPNIYVGRGQTTNIANHHYVNHEDWKERITDEDNLKFNNFFDLDKNNEGFTVFNQYNLSEALKRIENLTSDDIKDDLKYFQVKDFELRNYEERNSFSLDNIKFATSSKNEEGNKDYYLLNDLSEYLISNNENKNEKKDKKVKDTKEVEDTNTNIEDTNTKVEDTKVDDTKDIDKKILLNIQTHENGKKEIFIRAFINGEKLFNNIIKNFIDKSPFEKAKYVKKCFDNKLKNNVDKIKFKLIIKIQFNSLNKIYYNDKKGEYFLDLQNPPIFKTNIFPSNENEDEFKDENCLFPFRNFEDELSNLKYRHFIIMLQKNDNVKNNNNDENNNLDTNEELNHSLQNLFIKRNGEIEKYKYIIKRKNFIKLKNEDKKIKNLSNYLNYNKNREIKTKLKKLKFLKINENIKENENEEKYNDEEVIKLFYQVLALISENILSYYNGIKFLNNLLFEKKYRNKIFDKCKEENNFPIFFNITLTKILDKYQNSLEEKTLTLIFSNKFFE